jgi:hypothetical protein
VEKAKKMPQNYFIALVRCYSLQNKQHNVNTRDWGLETSKTLNFNSVEGLPRVNTATCFYDEARPPP